MRASSCARIDPSGRSCAGVWSLDNAGHAERSSDEPLDVVLQRGGVLFGHIERPAFFEEGHTVQLAMHRERGDEFCWAQFTPRGEFEAQGLLPGRWSAEMRVGFGGAIARIDGIVVAAGERVRDERIDLVRLDAFVRPVRVVARGAQRMIGLQAEVCRTVTVRSSWSSICACSPVIDRPQARGTRNQVPK